MIEIHPAFKVIVQRDADSYWVGTVPGLRGCHTQARNFGQLRERIVEAIMVSLGP